jgi:MOSC domain-containing protein YiiM
LVRRFHGTGRLGAIVLRPDRLKDAVSVQEARAEPGLGLIGDHRSLRLRQSDAQRHRELSLIQAEHLSLLGVWTGKPHCPGAFAAQPRDLGDQHRRDAFTFREERFVWRIGGSVRIEITGPCPPCSRMEDELGEGGYAALRGHGAPRHGSS